MKNYQFLSTTSESEILLQIQNQTPIIYCDQKQNSTHACLSKNCQVYAFVCQNKSCDCRKQHTNCWFVQSQRIISSLYKKITSTKSLEQRIEQDFEKIIDILSIQRDNILLMIKNNSQCLGLNQKEKQFFQLIDQNRAQEIIGNQIHDIFQSIGDESFSFSQIRKTSQQIKLILLKLTDQTLNGSGLIRSKLQSKLNILKNQQKQIEINSKIIVNQEQKTTLSSFFTQKKLKKMSLLYRASQNNFQASKFHQKCDNIPHTLTLVQTEFNKIIGGYTPLIWTSIDEPVKDKTGQSFIFSLSNKEKFEYDNDKYAIYRSKPNGPVFGDSACDWFICNKANQAESSNVYSILSSYKHSNYKKNDHTSWERFIGNPLTYKFKTKQWQVWQMQFDE